MTNIPAAELAARRAAWADARRTGAYVVVVQRGDVLIHMPLAALHITRGDTIIALVSPYSQEPARPTEPTD